MIEIDGKRVYAEPSGFVDLAYTELLVVDKKRDVVTPGRALDRLGSGEIPTVWGSQQA